VLRDVWAAVWNTRAKALRLLTPPTPSALLAPPSIARLAFVQAGLTDPCGTNALMSHTSSSTLTTVLSMYAAGIHAALFGGGVETQATDFIELSRGRTVMPRLPLDIKLSRARYALPDPEQWESSPVRREGAPRHQTRGSNSSQRGLKQPRGKAAGFRVS
jgi:hypothetical protein